MNLFLLLTFLQFLWKSYAYNSFQCSHYSISCSYYSCSYTDCYFTACYGDTITLSTCNYYSGDTYLSIYSSSYGTLASNDNYCGSASYISYTTPYSGCRTYSARQSCSPGYYNSCSGTTTVTISSPTEQPTLKPTAEPTIKPTPRPTSQPTLKPTFRPTAPTMSPTQLIVSNCPTYLTVGSTRPVTCVITTAICPGDNFTASTCGTAVGDTSLSLKLGYRVVATGDDGCGVVAGGSVLSYVPTGTQCALYTLSQTCYGSKPCSATTHYSITRIGNTLPIIDESSSSDGSSDELSVPDIIGITIGVTVGVCILLVGFGFFTFRLGTTYRRFQEFQDLQENHVGINMTTVTTKHYPQQDFQDIEGNKVIVSIPDDSSRILGGDEEEKQHQQSQEHQNQQEQEQEKENN